MAGKKLLSGRTPRLSIGRRANFTRTVSARLSAGISRTNRTPALVVSSAVILPVVSVEACSVGLAAFEIVATAVLRLVNFTTRITRAGVLVTQKLQNTVSLPTFTT